MPQKSSKRELTSAYSVGFSAFNILHMQKNGIVSAGEKGIKEVDIDINREKIDAIGKDVKKIEAQLVFIMKRISLSRDQLESVKKTDEKMLDALIESGMFEIGIQPHLLFVIILYQYFCDNKRLKIPLQFKKLTEFSLYQNIFEHIENSQMIPWKNYADLAQRMIQKGGNSC